MQIGDVLDVKFLMNPELDEQVIVRPDGRISTVIAQDVMAFGRTPYQLQQTLMRYYKEHLTNPKLSVIVRSYAPSRFYVLGEVLQPGEFVSVDPNITLLQAIARAGGLRNTADRDKIVVIRRRDGKKAQVMHANFDKASEGQDLMQDVRLANRDVVFVSRMGVADVHLYYEQYLQRFISPSLGIGYQLNSRID
jgi:polysaccharide export outer membrane protein